MYFVCYNASCGQRLPAAFSRVPNFACYCNERCAVAAGNAGSRLTQIRAELVKVQAAAATASAPPPRELPMAAQSVPVPPPASRPALTATPKKAVGTAKRPSR